MVLFIKDENKLHALWKKGVVTKVIYSKIDNIPRTIELRTTTGKIVRPIQKLAIPEWQIQNEENKPSSNVMTVDIADIALPEILSNDILNEMLSLGPARSPQKEG